MSAIPIPNPNQTPAPESTPPVKRNTRPTGGKKMSRLPKKLEPTIMRLIQESGIMMFPEQQTLDYIQNITQYRISIPTYYKLKKRIALDDTLWILNFSKGGFLHQFRKTMFVYENTLTKVTQQYNLELSREREDQDTTYLKNLVDHIIKINTLIAQFSMSSPMLAAMKMASDPQFRELDGIIDEKEKEKIIQQFGRNFGLGAKGEKGNGNRHDRDKYEDSKYATTNILIQNYNESVGSTIAERQGIRIERVFDNNERSESEGSGNSGSMANRPNGTGEIGEEKTGTADAEDIGEQTYRREKSKAVF